MCVGIVALIAEKPKLVIEDQICVQLDAFTFAKIPWVKPNPSILPQLSDKPQCRLGPFALDFSQSRRKSTMNSKMCKMQRKASRLKNV